MNTIHNLKEIAKHTTPISAFMALISVTLIAYTTNLIFILSADPIALNITLMLLFASLALSIIVALDLVDNYERHRKLDVFIESELKKQTQESDGK
ncbi:hypothetical protein [Pseudomonas savastanoi]|uniref:hypothetical protein n=1 Tax=Pseudomonas savastanoi TaxID=29438 RepID=UPI000EFFB237|nr:hypothetical protein [Pseudomonas savastanoi]RMM93448.1 hypothetical protein ALQ68_00361 [Pseudomonas savastanoi pv. glycinea]